MKRTRLTGKGQITVLDTGEERNVEYALEYLQTGPSDPAHDEVKGTVTYFPPFKNLSGKTVTLILEAPLATTEHPIENAIDLVFSRVAGPDVSPKFFTATATAAAPGRGFYLRQLGE